MKAIKSEIIEELEMYEKKAEGKQLHHTDLSIIKNLCETLFALDEVKEMWEHKDMEHRRHEDVHNPAGQKVY